MPSWASTGKKRAAPRDEGSGGAEGIVLTLDVTSSSAFEISYTVAGHFGPGRQKISLQVDTGSSDLWVASRDCSSSACSSLGGRAYDSSSSTPTGYDFGISYLQGRVSGPIVWDALNIGGYSLENQAFAAADFVLNEPLSSQFGGVLGLALPLNSIIASAIPPVTGNAPDGAAWASNLFSITPSTSAPAQRFISLSLSRPGSSRIPAQLGIGRHPANPVSDPSKVLYSTLVSEREGTLFWKVGVREINVYVNGQRRPVDIGRSSTGAAFPSAVLDSGVPLFLTTSTVANGIYGAIGVSPASDGNYYVPCTTPLNLTITIDNRPEIPIHPLDLTTEPPKDTQADYCIGLIQAADALFSTSAAEVGDMILGVPFLRNVYTVMAYAAPHPNGTFVPTSSIAAANITPRLGLMPLTDPTEALEEFRRVRVLRQPIDSNSGPTGNGGGGTGGGSGSDKGIGVGIIALAAILGFFALSFALFGLRWWLIRRKFERKDAGGSDRDIGIEPIGVDSGGMGSEGKQSMTHEDYFKDGLPPEDVMRNLRYEAYMQYNVAAADIPEVEVEVPEQHATLAVMDDSEDPKATTTLSPPPPSLRSNSQAGGGGERLSGASSSSAVDEMGYKRVKSGWWSDPDDNVASPTQASPPESEAKEWTAEVLYSSGSRMSDAIPSPTSPDSQGRLSITIPLLDEMGDHHVRRSASVVGSVKEFGGDVPSMAGIGTATRGGRIGSGLRRESGASDVRMSGVRL